MEATKSFFGESGLSSTRANQVAELADRYADEQKSVISSIQFYSEQVRIIGEDPIVVENGSTKEYFSRAMAALDEVADCNSLIAFFREAIKEKERLSKEAKEWRDEAAREILASKRQALREERNSLKMPKIQQAITEDDVKCTWSIGEQERYLSLQAECAVIGRFIHKDGALDQARKDLLDKIKHPRTVRGEGREMSVTEYIPSVEMSDVDAAFFELQARWRDKQGQLNGMKKKIEDAIHQDAAEKINAHEIELSAYKAAVEELNRKDSLLDVEEAEIERREIEIRSQMLEEIRNLKIVIPKRLEEIFYAVTK